MYTQCPECSSAFRVTADVLKVAAGMVRCGSCSHAFNSLDFLSEEKPQPKRVESQLPELIPEPEDTEESLDDLPDPIVPEGTRPKGPPQSISAEHSAALLKTLDQLAGEDIRIEDTGVEWRVLDDDIAEETADKISEDELLSDPEVTNAFMVSDVERYNDERERAEEAEQAQINDAFADGTTELDEDLGDTTHSETRVQMDANVAEVFGETSATDDVSFSAAGDADAEIFDPLQTHVDEVLDDSETPIHELVAPEQTEQPPAEPEEAEEEVLRFDDNTPLPEEFLADDSASKAVEIETPSINDSQSFDTSVTLGNPDEWQQLLDDFDDLLSEPVAESSPETDVETLHDDGEINVTPVETTHQFDPIVDAREADAEQAEASVSEPETEESGDDWDALPSLTDETAVQPFADSVDDEAEAEADDTDGGWDDTEGLTAASLAEELDALDGSLTGMEADTHAPDEDVADLDLSLENNDEDVDAAIEESGSHATEDIDDAVGTDSTSGDFEILPQSEEEQTINMLIDQDLLSIAREDEDGFTSTIVFEPGADTDSENSASQKTERRMEETILAEEIEPDDSVLAGLKAHNAAADANSDGGGRKKLYWFAAAAAVLALVFGGQVIHQKREQLATNPSFLAILSPVYSAIGMPLEPNWDVSRWSIERTQGATDGTDQLLTIISEIRNRSDQALPYPIITVSLTNRSQDSVGSLIVEPGDYLPNRSTGTQMVPAGEQFQAHIPVDTPPAEASGYTINACYRISNTELRCANEDFLR